MILVKSRANRIIQQHANLENKTVIMSQNHKIVSQVASETGCSE